MGDSACLMHSFSYASGIHNEANQGNPMHALGQSVSFGRYMTDQSLDWGKWSTFSHRRYVEEAEKYAQPGSVAQKKAFFEAYYKRKAAEAALVEQANAANNTAEPEGERGISANNEARAIRTTNERENTEAQKLESYTQTGGNDEKAEVTAFDTNADSQVKPNEQESSNTGSIESHTGKLVGVDHLMPKHEHEYDAITPAKRNSLNHFDNVDNQDTVSGSEQSGTPQMEKPLLKKSSCNQDDLSVTSKRRSALSSIKSSLHPKASTIPPPPPKPIAPAHLKKAKDFTPITTKPTLDTPKKKRLSPKSLRSLINFCPAKEPEVVPALAIRKTESSKVAPASSYNKGIKDCATPLRTPTMASQKGNSKYPIGTPCSESRRTKTPVNPPAPGSKTTGPKWHLLSAVYSKSLTACRNKLQSPTLSTPFVLRTEERAARRKQKLEEKFNAKAKGPDKVQLQTKLKEKAGTELRKLRQSFCFKARPLPDFYKEREASNNQTKKNTVTQPQSQKSGRKPFPSGTQSKTSMRPSASLSRRDDSENSENSSNIVASSPDRITHENRSPNIQKL